MVGGVKSNTLVSMEIAIVLILLYFGLTYFFSWASGPQFSSKTIYYLRAFFPSWRFFEDMSKTPLLLVRSSEDGESFGPWGLLVGKITPSVSHFLFSPQGNLHHSYSNHLQHLIDDLNQSQSDEDFGRSVGYRLTRNLVQFEIGKRSADFPGQYFQFKVSVQGEGQRALPTDCDDIFISVVHPVGESPK